MRNLRNLRFDNWRLQNISQSAWDTEKDDITATCWDAASDAVLCVIGPTEAGAIELVRISDGEQPYVEGTIQFRIEHHTECIQQPESSFMGCT